MHSQRILHSSQCMRLCVVLGCVLAFGCDKTEGQGASSKKSRVSVPIVDWEPKPIELPKPVANAWSKIEDMHAAELSLWAGVGAPIELITFTSSGDNALVALADGQCHVIDPKTGESKQHWDAAGSGKLVALEVTLDDKHVVLQRQATGNIEVRKLADGEPVATFDHSPAKVSAFAVATDPRLVAVGDDAGSVLIWNIESGKALDKQKLNSDAPVSAISFSADCLKLFVAQSDSSSIAVLELPGLIPMISIEQSCSVPVRLVASWGGDILFVLTDDRIVQSFALREIPGFNVQPNHWFGGTGQWPGELANCFYIPPTGQVCCYLGGKSFEYRGLPSGALAGRDTTESEGAGPVGLSRDGAVAGTGFGDGSVRFYKMPGPALTSAGRQQVAGRAARALFAAKNYDELDPIANQWLDSTKAESNLWSLADSVHFWLSAPGSTDWPTHLEALEGWLKAKPQSRAAHYALAFARSDQGWNVRGGDIAVRTSGDQFQGFHEQLAEASKLLAAADALGNPSGPICALRIRVSMGLGRPKDELIALWQRGIEDGGNFPDLHSNIAQALLPRWSGDNGDVARIADQARKQLPPDVGLMAYAVMANMCLGLESASLLEPMGFDLDTLEEAAQTMIRLYPEGLTAKSGAAVVACARRDRAAARERLRSLAGEHYVPMWQNPHVRADFLEWSRGKAVASGYERSFLASWFGLTHVKFSDQPTGLITGGGEPANQIQLWDVTDGKRKAAIPYPTGLWPWFMSDDGRFLAGEMWMPTQRVLLMDQKTGRMITTRDGATHKSSCLSSDGHEFATSIGNQISVYDLDKMNAEPAHVITSSAQAARLTFPNQSKAWCLAVGGSDGALRCVSAEGKDLMPPVQLPRVIDRLTSVPGSAKVVAGGPRLLAIVDTASGQATKLVDAAAGEDASFTYSGLTASRDGRLVAAARSFSHALQAEHPYDIEIWDIIEGHKLHVFPGHEAEACNLSFSSDGNRLASGDKLGFVHIWDLKPVLEELKNMAAVPGARANVH